MRASLFAVSWSQSNWLRAIAYLVGTGAVAWVVDWLLASRGGGVTRRLSKKLPPAGRTRLRVARRLIVAAIVFVGVTIALFQLPQVGTLARAMLASAALTAVVIGLAARSALANPLAGIAIAITQPVRINDYVTVGDVSGVVEEVGLSYTYIRTADNRRVVIPNEALAGTVVHNYTIVDEASAAAVDFVVPPAAALADVTALALEEAAHFTDAAVGREPSLTVTELTLEGMHLRLSVWAADKQGADRAASDLRLALSQRLATAGILGESAG